jgi:hypothetical protein
MMTCVSRSASSSTFKLLVAAEVGVLFADAISVTDGRGVRVDSDKVEGEQEERTRNRKTTRAIFFL